MFGVKRVKVSTLRTTVTKVPQTTPNFHLLTPPPTPIIYLLSLYNIAVVESLKQHPTSTGLPTPSPNINAYMITNQHSHGSQNVSEEEANHQKEAAGEDKSAQERRKCEQARGGGGWVLLSREILEVSFSKTPFSCNLSDQTLILSPKYGLYYCNFQNKNVCKICGFQCTWETYYCHCTMRLKLKDGKISSSGKVPIKFI